MNALLKIIIILSILTLFSLVFFQSKVDPVVGPGYGWHDDYAHFNSEEKFTHVDEFPQREREYPSSH